MQSSKKPILENPFHPLDLSPEDLLRIYKRFEESRRINKNPQQQLPIDTIAQLIASLKEVKPSYVQKCITQAFIKPTISWNDFLTLLDQESQVREKILQWLLFDENNSVKHKLKGYVPFRVAVQKKFEQITFLQVFEVGEERLCILELDNQQLILCELSSSQKNSTGVSFKEIDRYQKENSKTNLDILAKDAPASSNRSRRNIEISKVFVQIPQSKRSSSLVNKSLRLQSERLLSTSQQHNGLQSTQLRSSDLNKNSTMEDDDSYYKKERKNIHSVFNVFKDLELEDSIGLANLTANKINDRTFNSGHANSIRDSFADKVISRPEKIKEFGPGKVAPFEKAQRKLRSLYDQKSKLSYNPYRLKKIQLLGESEEGRNYGSSHNEKKISHERKQKSYTLKSITMDFNREIDCLGVVYHNLELAILRVGKDLNKMCFSEQDLLRIALERDHKKNEIVEDIKFYHHTIRSQWFLLVLVRVEFKSENTKLSPESYVLGFEVEAYDNNRKDGFNYRFVNRFASSAKRETFCLKLCKTEAVRMQIEPKGGIHVISYTGKYITYREEFIENEVNPAQSQYWRLANEEKFKNSGMSFCCLAVGSSINKTLFGTNNGHVILYDTFSRKFKTKKVSNKSIVKVAIEGNNGYVLSSNQKVYILSMNINRFEELDLFSTINENKLHEKVGNFSVVDSEVWTFGSELKIYDQEIDEVELHKQRQMEKTYTWRLVRLKSQSGNKQLEERICERLSQNLLGRAEDTGSLVGKQPQLKGVEMVVSSEKYFVVLSEILEVMVVEKEGLRVKFSFILDVPYDMRVMRMALSPNQKLLAVLLFDQSVYVYNIYTQDLYTYLKPATSAQLRFVSIAFLDPKNEYLLVAGCESGDMALIPYSSVPEKSIEYLHYHTRPVNTLEARGSVLLSSCEAGRIAIWQMPFNVIKHEFSLASGPQRSFVSRVIGFYSTKSIYLRTNDDQLLELSLQTLKLNPIKLKAETDSTSTGREFRQSIQLVSVDPITNSLLLTTSKHLYIFNRTDSDSHEWTQERRLRFKEQKSLRKSISMIKSRNTLSKQRQEKRDVIDIGVIGSEKIILFCEGGGALVYSYQEGQKSNQQSDQQITKYVVFDH